MAGKKQSPRKPGGDILEENRLDNIARTEDHNWDPDKPARPKNRPIIGLSKIPMKDNISDVCQLCPHCWKQVWVHRI